MDSNALVVPAPRRNRRHAPEFKARVIAACLEPGVSIAAVALANGLNANFLRTWVKAHREQQQHGEMSGSASDSAGAPTERSVPALVPVAVKPSSDAACCTIELEIRRPQTVIAIRWPTSEASACGQWLRDLLR
jgi:transposase